MLIVAENFELNIEKVEKVKYTNELGVLLGRLMCESHSATVDSASPNANAIPG